ncbi:MAG: DEAD/DEAH box helicase family protein [Patescibacteria group bacterium]
MNLRQHQKETIEIIDGIIGGSPVTDIVIHATPGSGKSTIPIIAGKLITAGLADKIAWISPRMSLQDQAERNFLDPRFRQLFHHNLTIRTATNDHNPCRGLNGFVSTYQALAVDQFKTVLRDFERYRYILVLDEFHHLEEDGEWTEPIKELYRAAKHRVLMTGTLQRGDEKKVAFLNYVQMGDKFVACPMGGCPVSTHDFISYTRSDALADQAILPLEFHFADGLAKWRKESGKEIEAKLSTSRADANQALWTALNTEYAQELLLSGVSHWQDMRRYYNPQGSLLVVAASIKTAQEYTEILKRQGLHAEIATSDDTQGAVRNINALKAGKIKILVTVAMAYEGLDVPSISHIICLTNVRSQPWIEQMVARAVRIDPAAGPYESQRGYIFAPADKMFVELAQKIEQDQTEAVAKASKEKEQAFAQTELFGGESGPRIKITPLSSRLLHGQQVPFEYHNLDTGEPIRTQREIERELREEIDGKVKAFCRTYNVKIVELNHKIKEKFGKARDRMTVEELKAVEGYLKGNYAVPGKSEVAGRWV